MKHRFEAWRENLTFYMEDGEQLEALAAKLNDEYPDATSQERDRICEQAAEPPMLPGYESRYYEAERRDPRLKLVFGASRYKWVHAWKTPVMPAPSFYYYDTKAEARIAHEKFISLYASLHEVTK